MDIFKTLIAVAIAALALSAAPLRVCPESDL
jgi:hypothetical protein